MHDVSFGSGLEGHPYIVEAGANWVRFGCARSKSVAGDLPVSGSRNSHERGP